MKIDPYKHKERYLSWKEKVKENGIPDISKENSDLILQYLEDMENGINVSVKNVKGARSYIRLNTLREKLISISKKIKEIYNLDNLTKIKEEEVVKFFSSMRKGEIKTKKGEQYKSVQDFVKVFKAFWHWWMRISNKQKIEIPDITLYVDARGEKPEWVYLNEEQVKKLCDNAKYEYRVLIMFLFDSGIRSPTELMNIKVSDLYEDFKELNIRDEISKTFGRRIKLMLCSELVKEYVSRKELKKDDPLFKIIPYNVNKYLKRLGKNVLGEEKSLAGQRYSQLTMYDFRHCSCCYWLPRYKSESVLKFRFGWKKSDKIHYYSEMLGMRDTIQEEDLFLDVTKTEIERRLEKSEREKELIQEKMKSMEEQMQKILEKIEVISARV